MSGRKKEAHVRSRREVPGRMPLKDVVADCERRWFEAALEAARNGEVDMQSLVGQMFCSGYGVAVDMKKGKFWLEKSADANEDARNLLNNLSEDYFSEPSKTEILDRISSQHSLNQGFFCIMSGRAPCYSQV